MDDFEIKRLIKAAFNDYIYDMHDVFHRNQVQQSIIADGYFKSSYQ